MAAFAHGVIQWLAADIATTAYTVSGLAFQPKALRFYTQGLASAVDTASDTVTSRRCVGFAVSTASRRCVATEDRDNVAAAICATGWRNDAAVATVTASPAWTGLLDLSAINSDGFTMIVDQAVASDITVFWEAWGGTDITVAVVGDIAEPAATGNQDYAVTGFVGGATNQVVMFAGVQETGVANTATENDSGLSIGFATSGTAADNVVVVGHSEDSQATMATVGYALSGECLSMIDSGGTLVTNARATLTQFGTDTFRLNWLERAITNRRSIFLAIKGGMWKAGSYTIDNSTIGNTTTVSALGFQPNGGCAMGRLSTQDASDTATSEDKIGLGSWSSTSSRRAMGHRSENGTANSEIDVVIAYAQMLVFPSNAGAVDSAYDIDVVNADGFRVIVDDPPGTTSSAEWQAYLAFGDVPISDAISQANITSSAGRFIGWTT